MNSKVPLIVFYFLLQNLFFVSSEDCFDHGIDYYGNDLEDGHYVSTGSAEACQINCQETSGCNFWSWDPSYHSACWKKYAKGEEKYAPAVISGPKNCGDVTTEAPDPNNIRIMSYNMYGWNANQNPYKKDNMYKIIRAFNPDTLGVQESFNDEEISENIGFGTDYSVAGGAKDGHTIIYKTSVFDLNDFGVVDLTPHDKYGVRSVEYALFTHKASGKLVDHFNTHFCVCTDQVTQCCGQEGQFQSAIEVEAVINERHRSGSLIFFTGDLNVQDGLENSKTIRYLKGNLDGVLPPVILEDTFRTANGENSDGTTYPHVGKIDYIFASPGTQVTSASIDRGDYGGASDHWSINAIIKV